jgi:hypothetical protein
MSKVLPGRIIGRGCCACWIAGLLVWAVPRSAPAQMLPRQYNDGVADARILRFDGSTNGVATTGGVGPDLRTQRIGAWSPHDPLDNRFRGNWVNSADFFRLDLVFNGLVCPPGWDFPTNIFYFGDQPLLGFVEFDVDASVASGGELLGPQFRYTGSAGRFGGLPQPARFADRILPSNCPHAFDANIATGPYFPERSGEEFHLAFLWGATTALDVGSNGDYSFDPGETWTVRGNFLNRALGFNDFILVCCSNGLPNYNPEVELQFSHSQLTDRTTVSLVYPLTQAGAALLTTNGPEPMDCCANNQSSIEEGLEHLVLSAQLASATDRADVNFPLIAPWEFQTAADYLDPRQWDVQAAFVGAFTTADAAATVLAWTDVAPNALPGDFNADGMVDATDVALFDTYLAEQDGGACDADGTSNGIMTIVNFGDGFDVHDVNYDGVVDAADRPVPPEDAVGFDADDDGDVDLWDFAILQRCTKDVLGSTNIPASCVKMDANHDGQVTSADAVSFTAEIGGPTANVAQVQEIDSNGWQAIP